MLTDNVENLNAYALVHAGELDTMIRHESAGVFSVDTAVYEMYRDPESGTLDWEDFIRHEVAPDVDKRVGIQAELDEALGIGAVNLDGEVDFTSL